MIPALVRMLGAVLIFSACSVDAPVPQTADDESGTETPPLPAPSVQPVDSTISPAVAGEEGRHYQQSADVDLTGDGHVERVVLTARVELDRGRPAWDDGQPV